MPRSVWADNLQAYRFTIMDVAPIDAFSLPVLTPAFGFSAISAPTITLETQDIVEGNWYYPKKVIKSGEISSITLSRGSTFYDSDFYRWVRTALSGNVDEFSSPSYNTATAIGLGAFENLTEGPSGASGAAVAGAGIASLAGFLGVPRIGGASPRRDLVLIQYFTHVDTDSELGGLWGPIAAASTAVAAGIFSNSLSGLGTGLLSAGINAVRGAAKIPAKAWKLYGCLPISYKVSSDFDASSSDVSIQELEVAVDGINEISFAAL